MNTPAPRRAAVAAACLALGLTVAACGSNNQPSAEGSTQGQDGQGAQQGGGQGGGGFGGLGGSGKVAAVSGKTAQVQGMNSQVAVTWTSATTFSRQISASASDLKVGDCVVALPDFQKAGPGSTTSGSAVAATSVRISTASKGSCATQGFGGRGFGGRSPQGGQGGVPSGVPRGAPSGPSSGRSGGGRGFGGAFGQVTAVTGSGFTVKSSPPNSGSGGTSTVSVTTSSTTTWTQQAAASAKSVKVGTCVVTAGRSSSTGAMRATSIAISQPENGSCTAGFGGRPPGFGGAGHQGGDGQNS
jgi:hypothetical protein